MIKSSLLVTNLNSRSTISGSNFTGSIDPHCGRLICWAVFGVSLMPALSHGHKNNATFFLRYHTLRNILCGMSERIVAGQSMVLYELPCMRCPSGGGPRVP